MWRHSRWACVRSCQSAVYNLWDRIRCSFVTLNFSLLYIFEILQKLFIIKQIVYYKISQKIYNYKFSRMKIVIWCVHFKIFKRFIERFSRVRNVDPYQVLPLSILVACSFVINENIYKYVNMFQMITSSELRFYCTKIFPSLSIRQNPAKHGKWAIFCWQINLPLKYSIEIVIWWPCSQVYINIFMCSQIRERNVAH